MSRTRGKSKRSKRGKRRLKLFTPGKARFVDGDKYPRLYEWLQSAE